MSEPQAPQHNEPTGSNGGKKTLKIHRVCIGCNNMFEVTMENYEAKHCPVCHKG